ncbi:hypothetical protein ACFX1W_019219 [Malus domestica]
MKVESKSISYHTFSLPFSLSLFFTCGTRRKRAISHHLVSIFRSGTDCLEPFRIAYLALLSSTHFQHLMLPQATTSAWGTDKGSENDTSKYVETMC